MVVHRPQILPIGASHEKLPRVGLGDVPAELSMSGFFQRVPPFYVPPGASSASEEFTIRACVAACMQVVGRCYPGRLCFGISVISYSLGSGSV